MSSQGRLLNLSCSTVPSLVLSITTTTQVIIVMYFYEQHRFFCVICNCVNRDFHMPHFTGPGSNRAVQRTRGTIQTGCLPAAKEDGQVSNSNGLKRTNLLLFTHKTHICVCFRWICGRYSPADIWCSSHRADWWAGQIPGRWQEWSLQTQLL